MVHEICPICRSLIIFEILNRHQQAKRSTNQVPKLISNNEDRKELEEEIEQNDTFENEKNISRNSMPKLKRKRQFDSENLAVESYHGVYSFIKTDFDFRC